MVFTQTQMREAEVRLRDAVNQPKVRDELIKDLQKWTQLCASMDAIGDTNSALAAYQRLAPVHDIEMLYLVAYGVLQVLFVQQDAVQHAAEAVGVAYELPEQLRDIREVRNCAIGHPTKRNRPQMESFGIVQTSFTQRGFTLYPFGSDNSIAWREISLPALIERQSQEVCDALARMVQHLKDRFGCAL